ncbi:MAG: hypothetical protein WA947_10205 [Phormidesmis sp.]
MTEPLPCEIQFTLDFRRQLKRLSKRYRSIKADLNSVIDLLKAKESLGDRQKQATLVDKSIQERWRAFDPR